MVDYTIMVWTYILIGIFSFINVYTSRKKRNSFNKSYDDEYWNYDGVYKHSRFMFILTLVGAYAAFTFPLEYPDGIYLGIILPLFFVFTSIFHSILILVFSKPKKVNESATDEEIQNFSVKVSDFFFSMTAALFTYFILIPFLIFISYAFITSGVLLGILIPMVIFRLRAGSGFSQ